MKFTWNIGNRLNRKTKQKTKQSYCHCSVIFVKKSPPIFNDNAKNKNWRIILLFIPFHSPHSAPFIKFPPLLRGGGVGGLHVLKWEKAKTWKLWTKWMTTQEINIAKIGNFIFCSSQHIVQLSWKSDYFWGGGGGGCLFVLGTWPSP